MSLLIIRAHKRFAVCSHAELRRLGDSVSDVLLIELSSEGCRLSNVASGVEYGVGTAVILSVAGTTPMEACVRWQREGKIGLRFAQPLHNSELDDLIGMCRGLTTARTQLA